MGGSRSDWSQGIWVTAQDDEAIEGSEPDHEGSIPTPTQNKLIILVLPQQFCQQNTFIMMQNARFCLKDECFSNLSAIFVVLIMWHNQTNQHQENVLGLAARDYYQQCILSNFQYSGDNPHFFCDCWLYFEGIWNNYIDHVDIQQQNMQFRFIMFLFTRGYNSLSDLTRSLKEKHVLKYKFKFGRGGVGVSQQFWFGWEVGVHDQLICLLFSTIYTCKFYKLLKAFFWHHKITLNHIVQ